MDRKRICVVGMDDFNRRKLEALPDAHRLEFVSLLDLEADWGTDRFPAERWYRQAHRRLEEMDPPADAIVGYRGFPITALTFVIANEFAVPAPSLQSVAGCDHKVLSRRKQSEAAPDHVPRYQAVNPFATDPLEELELAFPFWVKPLKAWGSQLGFKVSDGEEYRSVMGRIRESIGRFAEPMNWFLRQVELPEDLAEVDGYWCIAEEIIEGAQCTVSGYNYQGETSVYGVVDSVNYPDYPSFQRFQYPSRLEPEVQERCADLARRVMEHIGFRNGAFNVEFFYDREADHLWLLEINPRMSQSHAHLYEHVEGVSNHQVAIDIALGERPRFVERAGEWAVAAKFHLRVFEDGTVTRLPTREEVEAVQRDEPGTEVKVLCHPQQRLVELENQDSYSFRIAEIYVVGQSEETMLERYHRIVERLRFEVNGEPVQP